MGSDQVKLKSEEYIKGRGDAIKWAVQWLRDKAERTNNKELSVIAARMTYDWIDNERKTN